MDDTMFPLNELIIPLYNEKYNDNLTIDKITDYNFNHILKPECKDYWGEFMSDDIINQMQPLEDSVWVLKQFSNLIDLYCVTSGHPYTMGARHDLMSEHHSTWYNQIRMYRMPNKSFLPFEFMIDDYLEHFRGFEGVGLLLNRPWNLGKETPENVHRMNSWKDIYNFMTLYMGFKFYT